MARPTVKIDDEKNEERFEFISEQWYWGTRYSVLVDRATGITYTTVGENGRLTPLLDKDGKPYVDPRFGSR